MCNSISKLERDLGKRPIPILLPTMLDVNNVLIQKGPGEKIFKMHWYYSRNNFK